MQTRGDPPHDEALPALAVSRAARKIFQSTSTGRTRMRFNRTRTVGAWRGLARRLGGAVPALALVLAVAGGVRAQNTTSLRGRITARMTGHSDNIALVREIKKTIGLN